MFQVSQKMYLSLIKCKLKTTSLIFKIVTFLNHDFSNLNFDIQSTLSKLDVIRTKISVLTESWQNSEKKIKI